MIFTRAQLVHELGLIVMSCESRAYEAGEEPTKAMWEKRASVGQAILRLLEYQPFTQDMVNALYRLRSAWRENVDGDVDIEREGDRQLWDAATAAIERMQSLVNSH